jgi:hypothetical protein
MVFARIQSATIKSKRTAARSRRKQLRRRLQIGFISHVRKTRFLTFSSLRPRPNSICSAAAVSARSQSHTHSEIYMEAEWSASSFGTNERTLSQTED